MRHLLLLLLLLSPLVRAQEGLPPQEAGHANGGVEPALVPYPRPALVVGELDTPRFRILYTAHAEGAARQLAASIETVRDAFVGVLGRDWPGVTELRLGVGRAQFEALALPGGAPPGWAVALAYPTHRIVLLDALTLTGPEGQMTLRHELAHVALGQLAPRWPRWFQEGFAQNLTGEQFSMTHYAALFRAVAQEKVFRFEHLAEGWPDIPADVEVAYAQSAAFVGWLSARYGPEGMGRLVDEVATGQPFEQAFGKALHTSLLVEEQAWRDGLSARYGWLPLTTSSSLVWLLIIVLGVAASLRLRFVKERRLTEMDAREAAEEAALREEFEAELLQERQLLALPGEPPPLESEARHEAETPDAGATGHYPAPTSEQEEDVEHTPPPSKPTLH